MNVAKKVLFSYSHEDEHFADGLAKSLKVLERDRLIEVWYDRHINAGEEWDDLIKKRIEEADIFLLLISPNFFASEYIYHKEMRRAMERRRAGDAIVVPVLLRHVESLGNELSALEALPRDLIPVMDCSKQDKAFADIASEIRRIIITANPQKARHVTMAS